MITPAPLPPLFRDAQTLWQAGNDIAWVVAFQIPRVAVGYRIYYFNWGVYPHANPNQQVIETRPGPYLPWEYYNTVDNSPFYKTLSFVKHMKMHFNKETPNHRLGTVRPVSPNMHWPHLWPRSHVFAFGDMLQNGGVQFMSIPSFYADIKRMVAGTHTINAADILQFPLLDVQGNPQCFLFFADRRDGQTPLLVSGFMDFHYMRPLQKRLLDLLPLAQKLPLAKFLEAATPRVAVRMSG